MTKLEKLNETIRVASLGNGTSRLTEQPLSVGGFISPNNRHLLNNLGALSKNYFEIGSHIGSSLISTVYGNQLESAIACDNFSLFNNDDSKQYFLKNCDNNIPAKYKLLEKDCFTIQRDELPFIDLFFIDGDHGYQSQKDAITYFAPFLADGCIIVVDDASWEDVKNGTMDGIEESGLNIIFFTLLYSGIESDCSVMGFWNGLFVFMIKK